MPIAQRFGLREFEKKNYHDLVVRDLDPQDVREAALTGFDAEDIRTLKEFCLQNLLLLTIRCPKINTRYLIGTRVPKPAWIKTKSDRDGAGQTGDLKWASDYDIMGAFYYARGVAGTSIYGRLITNERPSSEQEQPKLGREFVDFFTQLNDRLRHPFQHGGNDDFVNGQGAIKYDSLELWTGRYVAFVETRQLYYLRSFGHLHQFYLQRGLSWPYRPTVWDGQHGVRRYG